MKMACVARSAADGNEFCDISSLKRRQSASKSRARRKLCFEDSDDSGCKIDIKDTDTLLQEMVEEERERCLAIYNFDCVNEKSMPGSFDWVAVSSSLVPRPYLSKESLGTSPKIRTSKLVQLKISDFMKVKKRKINAVSSHTSEQKSKRRNLRRI
ncbi:uncharacterized protein LOC141914764 [Tubulanus polymorphus]|uniref:uncharacterized protein LOC141914764 n=1 Tax=Tubulanus polymorphus TaxID=672921 RepID=UPI003DA2846A